MTPVSINNLVSDPRRLIDLQNVHNFRDLGGYPNGDGQCTKWRTLFRADGLHRLGDDDLVHLRDLQLRSVIDLRTERERRERGIFPVESLAVQTHHLSIVDVIWTDAKTPVIEDAVEFLVWGYREMLDIGAAQFAEAFELLSREDVLPAVFHCAAGKDRTGILAALLLSSLGVDDEIICADYSLTEAAMSRTIAWSQVHMPELADRYRDIPHVFLASDPRAMAIILRELHDRHGSVARFVHEIGVDVSTIDRLKRALLEVG